MSKGKILIVEDESDIRELIHFHLYKNQYNVLEAKAGDEALSILEKEKIDLVLLDIMIPNIDGLEVCRRLKAFENGQDTKVIFISAKGEEEDIIKGLELGGDDYVTKPFSPKVLIARVKSVLRRSEIASEQLESIHGIQIDESRRKIFIDDQEIQFSMTEFQLLCLFVSRPGHVYTRGQIVDSIRGHNHAVTDRSVDTQLVSLRKKMGEKGKLIETVWGIGYRLKENEV